MIVELPVGIADASRGGAVAVAGACGAVDHWAAPVADGTSVSYVAGTSARTKLPVAACPVAAAWRKCAARAGDVVTARDASR